MKKLKDIPSISFHGGATTKEFELLNLSQLFSRFKTFKDHNPFQPHRIYFFALLIVTKGRGKHYVDFKEYDLNAGDVIKLSIRQVQSFQRNPSYEGYLFVFTEEFILNNFSNSSLRIISHLYNYHIAKPITFNQMDSASFLNELENELSLASDFAKSNIVAAMLELYLLKLERKSGSNYLEGKKSALYNEFIKFKNLVESDYSQTRNVKDYANKMALTNKSLNAIVSEFTGNTPKSFIDDYVILETKRAIVSTSNSFKEIAYIVGFDEVTNFTKFFKKKMNMTPKEFRAKQIN